MFKFAISAAGLLLTAALSVAAPIVSLHSSNVGIGSVNYDVTGTTITISETWTGSGPGIIQISGLEAETFYTVIKLITNDSGSNWNRLAIELADPEGQQNDEFDVQPYPNFIPAGFTTSNDLDGLSFGQGGSIPRTSSVFADIQADEVSDSRDFLDYSNGLAVSGGPVFSVQFALRDRQVTNNQPFLLVQRANAASTEVVPEPSTFALLGGSLAAVMYARRRRQRPVA